MHQHLAPFVGIDTKAMSVLSYFFHPTTVKPSQPPSLHHEFAKTREPKTSLLSFVFNASISQNQCLTSNPNHLSAERPLFLQTHRAATMVAPSKSKPGLTPSQKFHHFSNPIESSTNPSPNPSESNLKGI